MGRVPCVSSSAPGVIRNCPGRRTCEEAQSGCLEQIAEEGQTYARVVTNQVQPGKMDAWVDLVRNAVVPSLKEQSGFRGFVALVNREAGKSIGYSTWETEQDMVASETNGNYQQQIQARCGAGDATGPRGVRTGCLCIAPKS